MKVTNFFPLSSPSAHSEIDCSYSKMNLLDSVVAEVRVNVKEKEISGENSAVKMLDSVEEEVSMIDEQSPPLFRSPVLGYFDF